MKQRWLVLLLAAALPMTACQGQQEANAEEMADADQMASTAPVQAPDTTAQAVWDFIHEAAYEAWPTWPGKDALYQGTEPHGALLTTYLNEIALDALTEGSGPLPSGSIVVKENYMPDSTLAAVTVMYAADGYDAEHNDWFWAKYQADGSVDAAGRVQSCIGCHSAGDRGYLRTAYDGGM